MKELAKAKLYWLSAQDGGRSSLPIGFRYVTVATFDDILEPQSSEAWSLVIESNLPFKHGEWGMVNVSFLNYEGAPQHLLQQSQRFQLCEGRRIVAVGEIVKPVL